MGLDKSRSVFMHPIDRHDPGPVRLWQRRGHRGHRAAGQRVPPARRDLGQGDQDEAALLDPRMRQDQLVRRLDALAVGRQPAPAGVTRRVRQHRRAEEQQVQIDRPGAPARLTRPLEPRLDLVQPGQQGGGIESANHQNRGIHEVRARTGRPGGRPEQPADRANPRGFAVQRRNRGQNCRFWIAE